MRQIKTGYRQPASNICVFPRGVGQRKQIQSPCKSAKERVEFFLAYIGSNFLDFDPSAAEISQPA